MTLKRGKSGAASINKKLPTPGTAVCSVKSQGTLTIAEPVTAEDTMVIGSVTYTFKADGTAAAAGEIDMGADEAATKVNIVKALKGTDSLNSEHPEVTCPAAFSTDDLVITAKDAGAGGDAIATTEGLTHASNVFDDVTLGTTTAGVTGTTGDVGDQLVDATYLYLCVAPHDDGANWRRISLGSAY